jgi:hypothetical protein
MASQPNEPHDQFIKQYIPIVLKHLFTSQTSLPVILNEKLAIDVLCTARPQPPATADPALGLLGRLVAIHPTIIIEHYSNYLDLEDIDSCILRSSIYWELNKDNTSTSKTRLTKESALNPQPLQHERPFTWIFAARCSDNLLNRWNAVPTLEFGERVYRLAAPGLAMGIVNIEALPYNADTMLLKMLGKAESAKQAFADIIALDPQRELRNDIIEVSLKHCIYLERFKAELTAEELSFMTYLQDVESAYQQWVQERRAEGIHEGKLQIVKKMVQAKFGMEALAPSLSDRLAALTEPQLDELTGQIFQWSNLDRLVEWLNSLIPEHS